MPCGRGARAASRIRLYSSLFLFVYSNSLSVCFLSLPLAIAHVARSMRGGNAEVTDDIKEQLGGG